MFKHVVTVVGFLAACVGLYAWFSAPTERPEAEVYYADFELPSALAQQLHALTPLANVDESRSQFFKPSFRHRILSPDANGLVEQLLSSMSTYVSDKAPAIQHKNDFTFKGYWRITVRNRGSRSASSVMLHFPVSASGVVSRPHADATPVQELPVTTSETFAVGNVQPGEDSIILHAWTMSPPSEDVARKITMTHDMGTGKVHIAR
jgi:hypothetical protein